MISGAKPIAAVAALIPLVASIPACKERKSEQARPAPAHVQTAAPIMTGVASPSVPPSASPAPASSVPFGDPALAGQLVKGFYSVENQSWRWTADEFSVRLAIPPEAKEKGALLRLKFTVPEPVIKQHPSFTLTGKLGDAQSSKTYSKAGDYLFEMEIPTKALSGDSALTEFTIDKPFKPGGGDIRVLGVVAASVELLGKS